MNNIENSNEKFLLTQQELSRIKYKHKNKCKDPAYKKLKNDIIYVCSKIEKSLFHMFNSNNNISNNQPPPSPKITNDDSVHWIQLHKSLSAKINHYKLLTKDIEEQINAVYKMGKVIELEKNINIKEKLYNELKSENNILKQIKNFQSKIIQEYEHKTSKTSEIEEFKHKISLNKKETRSKREQFFQTETQIREQIIHINQLHNKIKNINENIQFLKEQKEIEQIPKECSFKIEEPKKNLITSKTNILNYIAKENNIVTLKKYEKERKKSLYNFKKEANLKLQQQMDLIEKLEKEIQLLFESAHQKEYDKRIIINRIKMTQRTRNQRIRIKNVFNRNALFHKPKLFHNSSFTMKHSINSKPFDYTRRLNDSNLNNNNNSLDLTSNTMHGKNKTLIQIEQLIKDLEQSVVKHDPKLPNLPKFNNKSKANCGTNTIDDYC